MRADMPANTNRGSRAFRAAARAICLALKRSEGGATIEAALILPAFLLIIFGVFDAGQLFWTQSTLQLAVQEAARCASINTTTCGSTSAIQSFAASKAPGISVAASSFSVTSPACGNMVQISWPFSFAVAGLFPYSSITLSAQSCYPK